MQQRLYWLEYDSVALAVLVIGIGMVELLALLIWRRRKAKILKCAGRAEVFGMTILKQAAWSITFAVLAVAVLKYGMWILAQKGWISPWTPSLLSFWIFSLVRKAAAGPIGLRP
jgi:hypothetical protein